MQNPRFLICQLVSLLVAGTLMAEYIPVGYEYQAPTGGVVQLSQDYGSGAGKDGQGTWSGTASVTLAEDSMTITAASWSYQKILMPLDIGDNANVIDICIKGWNSAAGTSSDAMTLNTACGTWGAKYAFNLRTDGSINPVSGKGTGTADLPLNTGTIIRLVRPQYRGNMYVLAGDDSITYISATTPSGWGASDSSVIINSGISGSNTMEIAWMKVYSGVDTSAIVAPLTAVPEPVTMVLLGMGSFVFVLRKNRVK